MGPARAVPDADAASADAGAAAVPAGHRSGALSAAALAFLPLLAAAGLTAALAAATGSAFQDAVLLPPGAIAPARFLAAIGALAAGTFALYFAPGWMVLRAMRFRPRTPVTAALAALTVSLAAMSAAWIAAMAVTDGVGGRACVYLTAAAVDAAALLLAVFRAPGAPAFLRAREGTRRELLVPVAGVLLMIAAAWILMPGKITTEALEGDATEVHGFAASLAESALPEWDLETGEWGFYPTFAFVGYPVWLSIALLGDSEAAVRFPALLFLGVLALAAAELAGRGRARGAGGSVSVLLPVLLVGYLSLQVGAYYAGYHPVHGDLGCSPLEEWIVTALAGCAVVLLRDGAAGWAAVAALLSILTFPSGLMLVGLLGLARLATADGDGRRAALRFGLALGGLLAAYAVFLVAWTSANGTFGSMMGEWYEKYFARRAGFSEETPERMALAVGWYTLLAGGLPVLGYVLAWRAGRTARWLALAGGAWTAFFVLSPGKNVHYFLPAAFFPVIVALRCFGARGPSAASAPGSAVPFGGLPVASGAIAASVLSCILLCRPEIRPPYTADREFGRRTYFLAASEREAVELSRVIYNLTHPLERWQPGGTWTIGIHTWVMYADRGFEPQRAYDFYVGEGPPPVPGLTEVTRIDLPGGRSARMWSPGGRAAFREWKERTFPAKRDQSRFNFEFPPAEEPRGRR
jgi:hypothetical protein